MKEYSIKSQSIHYRPFIKILLKLNISDILTAPNLTLKWTSNKWSSTP